MFSKILTLACLALAAASSVAAAPRDHDFERYQPEPIPAPTPTTVCHYTCPQFGAGYGLSSSTGPFPGKDHFKCQYRGTICHYDGLTGAVRSHPNRSTKCPLSAEGGC